MVDMQRSTFVLILVLLSILSWGHGYAAACTPDRELREFYEIASTAFLAAAVAFVLAASTIVHWRGP